MKFIILICTAAVFSVKASAQDFQKYQLISFPKNSGGCQNTADDLASRFSDVTKIAVFSKKCDRETRNGYDISIWFAPTSTIRIVSTGFESGGLGYLGVYGSAEDCKANLARQIATFEEHTKLKPFVSYCYRETDINKTPYVARVDGLGIAAKHPYRFEATTFSPPLENIRGQTASAILKAALSSKITATDVIFADDGAEKLVIRYYDKPENAVHRSYYFSNDEVATFDWQTTADPKTTCFSELAYAQKAFSLDSEILPVSYCTYDPMLFQSRLYVFRSRPKQRTFPETPSIRFQSYAECSANREKILDYYRNQLGKNPYAAVCSWDDGFLGGTRHSYLVNVYLKSE